MSHVQREHKSGAAGDRQTLWGRFHRFWVGDNKRRRNRGQKGATEQYGALEPRQLLASVSASWSRGGFDLGDSELQRPDLLDTVSVDFSSPVTFANGADTLRLFNDSNGGTEIPLDGVQFDDATQTWDFSNVPHFDPGYYSLVLDYQTISDAQGNPVPYHSDFDQQIYIAIPGDANLDGTVDVLGLPDFADGVVKLKESHSLYIEALLGEDLHGDWPN